MTLPTSSASQSGEAVPRRSAQDEPNYKALYTELKGEVLEKVGPALEQAAEWFEEYADHHQAKGALDKASRNLERANHLRRALSTLYDKLSSIEEASVAESAASVASDLTAGEAQRKSDWRTIDSAPRDGTRVLLGGMTSGPPVDVGYWGAARYLGRKAGYERAFVTGPSSGDVNPTHWQPLPPPPNPSARGEL